MWSGYRKPWSRHVRGFVGCRAEVAQAGMPPAGVVPALDVLEDCLVRLGFGGPRLPAEHLGLDRGEERFGYRVVPALPLAADRQADADLVGRPRVLAGGVLGGFNRWTQPRCLGVIVDDRRGLRRVSSSRVSCGVAS